MREAVELMMAESPSLLCRKLEDALFRHGLRARSGTEWTWTRPRSRIDGPPLPPMRLRLRMTAGTHEGWGYLKVRAEYQGTVAEHLLAEWPPGARPDPAGIAYVLARRGLWQESRGRGAWDGTLSPEEWDAQDVMES